MFFSLSSLKLGIYFHPFGWGTLVGLLYLFKTYALHYRLAFRNLTG